VFDPSAEAYPDTDQGRRNLYTAVTRAKDRLAFLGTAPLSPLLSPARDATLLEVADQATVEEVTFTEEEGVSTKFRVVVSSATRVTGRVRLS